MRLLSSLRHTILHLNNRIDLFRDDEDLSSLLRKSSHQHKFQSQILLDLRNAGFLYSKKGAGGGYSLNKDPKDIFLVSVMRITDGPIAMVPCASLNFYHKCDECHQETTCGIRDVFVDVRDATLKILTETSIADIIAREQTLINV